MPRTPVQHFMTSIKQTSREISAYAKIGPKNTPKMAPSRWGALFKCIDHHYYTKNNCKSFHDKILNDSQKIK